MEYGGRYRKPIHGKRLLPLFGLSLGEESSWEKTSYDKGSRVPHNVFYVSGTKKIWDICWTTSLILHPFGIGGFNIPKE